jgi:hypothetical protein
MMTVKMLSVSDMCHGEIKVVTVIKMMILSVIKSG